MSDHIKPPEGTGSKSLTALKSGGSLLPIYPQSIEEVYRFSQMAVKSGVLKPVVRRQKNPETNRWEDIVEDDEAMISRGSMIIAQGMEIGMPPLQALQLIMLVNGRLTVYAEGVPALLWSHGFKVEEWWIGNDGQRYETADKLGPVSTWIDHVAAFCKITRPNGVVITRSFSVGMAKTAKLWDRREKIQKRGSSETYDNDSAWFRFPDRLLRARAIGFCSKDGAADAMRGMMTSEEAYDIQRTQEEREQDTVRPIEVSSVPAIPFEIDLNIVPEPVTSTSTVNVPAQEHGDTSTAETAQKCVGGNIEEAEVIPDDEQALSAETEEKLLAELTDMLSRAVCPGEITAVERKFAPLASMASEDMRDALIERIDAARKRIAS